MTAFIIGYSAEKWAALGSLVTAGATVIIAGAAIVFGWVEAKRRPEIDARREAAIAERVLAEERNRREQEAADAEQEAADKREAAARKQEIERRRLSEADMLDWDVVEDDLGGSSKTGHRTSTVRSCSGKETTMASCPKTWATRRRLSQPDLS